MRFLGLSLLVLASSACFDSDELALDDDLLGDSTRGPKPNTTGGDETETEDDGPGPDLPPPEVTCSDAVACVLDCANELGSVSSTDEVDLSCFFDCEAGLTVDEALKLIELGACVFDYCTGEGFCEATPEDPLAPLDPNGDCIVCIGLYTAAPTPDGSCEAEFMACHGT